MVGAGGAAGERGVVDGGDSRMSGAVVVFARFSTPARETS
jgi:hypothetical protein